MSQNDFEKKLERDRHDNMELFRRRIILYNKIPGIRVGDWIKDAHTGDISRVTYIWRDEKDKIFQIQNGGNKNGQFYLGDGHISYSGGLDSGYDMSKWKIRKLSYERDGLIWFFKNDFATAHNGVEYMMRFRVFEAY